MKPDSWTPEFSEALSIVSEKAINGSVMPLSRDKSTFEAVTEGLNEYILKDEGGHTRDIQDGDKRYKNLTSIAMLFVRAVVEKDEPYRLTEYWFLDDGRVLKWDMSAPQGEAVKFDEGSEVLGLLVPTQ